MKKFLKTFCLASASFLGLNSLILLSSKCNDKTEKLPVTPTDNKKANPENSENKKTTDNRGLKPISPNHSSSLEKNPDDTRHDNKLDKIPGEIEELEKESQFPNEKNNSEDHIENQKFNNDHKSKKKSRRKNRRRRNKNSGSHSNDKQHNNNNQKNKKRRNSRNKKHNSNSGGNSVSNIEDEKVPNIVTKTDLTLPEGAYYSNQGEDNKYYQSLNGLNGIALFNKLFENQQKYTNGIKGYDYLFQIYNDAFKDLYYEKDNSVLDIYSENPKGEDPYNYKFDRGNGSSGKGEGRGFNREHLIAQSWFSKANPMKSDAHHVWPTDIQVNGDRSNYPHFIVSNPKKVSKNGTKIGNSNAEPINEFKGDVARAYFYFAATYVGQSKRMSSNGEAVFDWKSGKVLRNKYFDLYKQWSDNDKIDAFDIIRNNEIAKHQVIRNPFSDYPELIELIIQPESGKVFHNKGVLRIKIDK
ncbi:endonuclease [Mycoplasma sp. U97]|uniref:endonuclease n=1 Tax=Mycoplasma tauri TaxID=547987 RepID=UPI001CC00402|nr:endonuclease [Mycoplasma tauri]MBZ4212920.1 endonuclease [Mycoplasma tauri]